jgi:hypothetical protein
VSLIARHPSLPKSGDIVITMFTQNAIKPAKIGIASLLATRRNPLQNAQISHKNGDFPQNWVKITHAKGRIVKFPELLYPFYALLYPSDTQLYPVSAELCRFYLNLPYKFLGNRP